MTLLVGQPRGVEDPPGDHLRDHGRGRLGGARQRGDAARTTSLARQVRDHRRLDGLPRLLRRACAARGPPSTSARSWARPRCARSCSASDDVAADAGAAPRAWRRWSRRRCSRARSASRRRSSTRPASYAQHAGADRARPRRPRATAASTPPTSATRPTTRWRRSRRRSPSAARRRSRSRSGTSRWPAATNWGRMKDVVARIERARAEGLDVTADMYPYVASGNGLDATVPQWAQAGGVDAMIQRFHDPAQRARILQEIRDGQRRRVGRLEGPPAGGHPHRRPCSTPSLQKWTGKRLSQVAAEMGKIAGGGADRPRGGGPRQRLRGPLLDERGRPAVRAAPALGGHRPRRRRLLARRALRPEQAPSARAGHHAARARPLRARAEAVLASRRRCAR